MKRFFFITFFALIPALTSAQTWTKVSCGAEFTLALRSDGSLWSWGYNANGQLGIGTIDEHDSPIRVGKDTNWIDIAAGGFHSLALKKDGSLWAWGNNSDGELGDGSTNDQHSPTRIGIGYDWESIDASWVNSAAIKKDHSLYVWGYGGFGQTGDTAMKKVSVPKRIGSSSNWLKVSVGGQFVIALKTDHTLWSWGVNTSGQLGQSSSADYQFTPAQIGSDTNWKDIDAGFQFTAALRSDRSLWTWGFNGSHQLGYVTLDNFSNVPKRIDANEWVHIAAGSVWCFGVKPDGTLWAWGDDNTGECGINGAAQYDIPTQVGAQTDWKLLAAATGVVAGSPAAIYGLHSIGIRTDATSLCVTGVNYVGQLGTGLASGPILQFTCNAVKVSVTPDEITDAPIEILVYPNPATTNVTVTLPEVRTAKVEVFDLLGNTLRTFPTSESECHWDLRSTKGEKVSAGSYVIRSSGVTNDGKRFVVSKMMIVQ